MGAVTRLLGRRGEEERMFRRESQPLVLFGGGPLVVGGESAGLRGALSLPDVWACISLLANVASTLPLVGYRRAPSGRERLAGGKLVRLLAEPSPGTAQGVFVGQLVMWLAARGEAFIGLYAGDDGLVAQLGIIAPERVQVRIVSGEPRYRLAHLDGTQTEHTTDDIVHVRLPLSLDGVRGASPLALLRESFDLARALAESARANVANESVPLGLLRVPPGPGADDAVERLREAWERRHGGPANRGRVAVLSGEIGFVPVSLSPEDAQLVEQRRLSTQEVARVWGIPPVFLNAPANDALTYSTTESMSAHLVRFTLSAYTTAIEQALSASPLCSELSYVEFLYDALMRPDTLTRYQAYQIALGNPQTGAPGFMTRGEVRERENLPAETSPVAA